MLRDLLTQKKRLLILDTPARACRFRKYQIGLPLPSFFKMWFNFIKCGFNGQKLTDFQTFSSFHVFQVVEHTRAETIRAITVKNETFSKKSKIWFLPIFANFCLFFALKITIWKKLVEEAPGTYFQFWCFLNLHALGYPKSVTFFCARTFGLTSPSAWCEQPTTKED
jgi:hypothetical protein